jgi:hypothetical protein
MNERIELNERRGIRRWEGRDQKEEKKKKRTVKEGWKRR